MRVDRVSVCASSMRSAEVARKDCGREKGGKSVRGATGAFIAYGSAKHLWNNGPAKYIVGEEKRKYLARENRKMGFHCAPTWNVRGKYFTSRFCVSASPLVLEVMVCSTGIYGLLDLSRRVNFV